MHEHGIRPRHERAVRGRIGLETKKCYIFRVRNSRTCHSFQRFKSCSPVIDRLGLIGMLEKTKATAVGKWTRHLPIYTCHSA